MVIQSKAGSDPTSSLNDVNSVWSTEAQNRGHTFDRTGPVGYSIQGTTFVTPKKDRYIGHGGTCEKVTKGWCRDDSVSRKGTDLSVMN